MANTIELAKVYTSLVDEIYANESKTMDLVGTNLVKEGATAKEVLLPKIEVDGAGDYDRSTGYPKGDCSITWESHKYEYDRAKQFHLDEMDAAESFSGSLGAICNTFMKTRLVPEADAYTFATLAKKGSEAVSETLETGEDVIAAISKANAEMTNKEVPTEGRILYITPALMAAIDAMDTTKSRACMSKFAKIVEVPEARFVSAITLSATNGYSKASGGKTINFMIVDPQAVIKHDKQNLSEITRDPNFDGYVCNFRHYGIVSVEEKKKDGVHTSVAAA